MNRRLRSHSGRLVFGVVLMAVGTLFLLDEFFDLDVGSLWDFWPLLLVGLGIAKVSRPAGSRGRGAGVFLMVLGAWLLLDQLDVLYADETWPILLMTGGAIMVVRALKGRPTEITGD